MNLEETFEFGLFFFGISFVFFIAVGEPDYALLFLVPALVCGIFLIGGFHEEQ